ncbi:MAG: Uma2 family endonuclease [Alphaproteobacteria bacterium]|nr:Uma2 family endonuclease [Alphaproteobacteria bacterium]
MPQAATRPWTTEDFLAWERQQEERYEWHDGIVRAMVGGTLAHSRIVNNLVAALRPKLRGTRCAAYSENVKVRVGLAITYPDLAVTCSPQQLDSDLLSEPAIIAEVLSPSTELFDRGRKWTLYQGIASLRQYVLISRDSAHAESYTRRDGTWHYAALDGLAAGLALEAIDMTVPLSWVFEETGVANAP